MARFIDDQMRQLQTLLQPQAAASLESLTDMVNKMDALVQKELEAVDEHIRTM